MITSNDAVLHAFAITTDGGVLWLQCTGCEPAKSVKSVEPGDHLDELVTAAREHLATGGAA